MNLQRFHRISNHLQCSLMAAISNKSCKSITTTNGCKNHSVLIEEHSGNFLVTLNREKALNALNIDMIDNYLLPFYQQIISDKKPCTVILKGAGEKAFCAGGDIRYIYDLGLKCNKNITDEVAYFFKTHYDLDYILGCLPSYIKNVCLLNGITMGGGVGISVHGKYRIAGEQTLFAMPETFIGYNCDVGGSYFLPRLVPNGLGLYLGLTGKRLKSSDCLHAGIATHFVQNSETNLKQLEDELLDNKNIENVESILNKYSTDSKSLKEFSLKNELQMIEKYFMYDSSMDDIFNALEMDKNDCVFASNTLAELQKMSPTSLKIVYRAVNEGSKLGLHDCLNMEYYIAKECMRGVDFYEGVRAVLAKDRNPIWNPSNIKGVESIDHYFPYIANSI